MFSVFFLTYSMDVFLTSPLCEPCAHLFSKSLCFIPFIHTVFDLAVHLLFSSSNFTAVVYVYSCVCVSGGSRTAPNYVEYWSTVPVPIYHMVLSQNANFGTKVSCTFHVFAFIFISDKHNSWGRCYQSTHFCATWTKRNENKPSGYWRWSRVAHVGTGKVRWKSRVKINWSKFRAGLTTHSNKQVTERGDEQCFKGQNLEFMTCMSLKKVFTTSTPVLAPWGLVQRVADTQVTGDWHKNRVSKLRSSFKFSWGYTFRTLQSLLLLKAF